MSFHDSQLDCVLIGNGFVISAGISLRIFSPVSLFIIWVSRLY